MTNKLFPFLSRYGFAFAAIALATWVRLLLDPALGNQYPFATFFFAVLFTAWYGGFGPALAAAVLGALAAGYFVVPPRGSFAFEGSEQRVGMILYVTTSLAMAALGGSMHAAQRKAEASADNQRRQAALIDQLLQAAEERFHLLVEGAQDYANFMLDADGRVMTWNKGAERTKGYREDEIVGRHFSCFYPEEDVARGKPQQELQTVLSAGRCQDEGWRVRKDGSRFWARVVITALHDKTGRLRGFAKVTRDITEGMRAQERFRQAVESAPNGMVMVNPAGAVVLVNEQTERLFGYNRDELLGQAVELLVPDRFRARHPEYRTGFFTHPQVRSMGVGRDLFGRRKDGSEFPVEIGLNPIHTDEGLFVLSAIVDITERKRAEDAMRQLNADLLRGMQQLGEVNQELQAKTQEAEAFVYSVSHDLRSPLVNLQGFSKELGRSTSDLRALFMGEDVSPFVRERGLKQLDGPIAKSLRFIQTAVSRLSDIIDALLRLSRAGRVIYQRQRVDMQAVVARIVESLKITVEERGATIQIDNLPPAQGDATALEQVFANLIGNALNYLDAKRPGLIEIGCAAPDRTAPEKRTYYVRDNGLGIPEAGTAKVFQPFQRLHPQAAKGEGMGLAVVQRVVERHGGKIWFESAVDKGTTFFVALPVCQDEDSKRGQK